MLSYNMTANEIAGLSPELVILPIGSIEQHGPHLPVSIDWNITTALGAVLQKRQALFDSLLAISTCRENQGKKARYEWILMCFSIC